MTLTQLKTRVLERIGVLASGENPDADDADVVSKRYEMVYNLLLDMNLATWAVIEDIPDSLDLPMLMIVSYYSAAEFGIVGQLYDQLKVEGALQLPKQMGGPSLGEHMLRKSLTESYTNEPAQPDYF